MRLLTNVGLWTRLGLALGVRGLPGGAGAARPAAPPFGAFVIEGVLREGAGERGRERARVTGLLRLEAESS